MDRSKIANRWMDRVMGLALMSLGVIALAHPVPQVSFRRLEAVAACRVTNAVNKTALGREVLAMYCGQECHRTS